MRVPVLSFLMLLAVASVASCDRLSAKGRRDKSKNEVIKKKSSGETSKYIVELKPVGISHDCEENMANE
jgi:hypothetical protein